MTDILAANHNLHNSIDDSTTRGAGFAALSVSHINSKAVRQYGPINQSEFTAAHRVLESNPLVLD